MRAQTRQFRDSFDPAQDFIVKRPIRLSGEDLKPGSVFDKTRVPLRRLRQLFDSKLLAYPGETGKEWNKPVNPSRERLGGGNFSPDAPAPAAKASPAGVPAPDDALAAIEIPEDWERMPWYLRVQLAAKFSKVRLPNKAEAHKAIQDELDRRAALVT